MMKQAPEFVSLVRSIVPKDGLSLLNTKPNRIKSKVKKALNRAGYETETIRGVGLKIGEFAVIYEVTAKTIKASFDRFDTLPILKAPTRKRGTSKKKAPPILTGTHHSVLAEGLSIKDFALEVLNQLPQEWERAEDIGSARWISTDMGFMYNTQHSVESAAKHIVDFTTEMLASKPVIRCVLMVIGDEFLIGVGPA